MVLSVCSWSFSSKYGQIQNFSFEAVDSNQIYIIMVYISTTPPPQSPFWNISQYFSIFASQYLRNVFVCFFPPLLYLPLNANNPHCTSPSCLHDHKGKKNTWSVKHTTSFIKLARRFEGHGNTDSKEGTKSQSTAVTLNKLILVPVILECLLKIQD